MKATIRNPITLDEEKTVRDAKQLMEQYSIGGLPVLSNGKLVELLQKEIFVLNQILILLLKIE